MKKVITFGEILLRLSTERHLRFSQAESFKATYGGGEFNVAVSLVNYGMNAEYVTKIPNNELGISALKEMRKLNVGCEHVLFGGDRLGIYFLETGTSTRASNVIYDRENSSMANLHTGEIDWKEVLTGATWFHWSGITPALSQNAADACLEAIKVAHEMGLTISTDLNYRAKLWNYGKEPKDIMPAMLKYSHVILGDIDTAYFMLGLDKVDPDYSKGDNLTALYDTIFKLCPDMKYAATTLRYSVSASHQRIGGVMYDGTTIFNAAVQEVTPVVDRVGSGDAFMGGLIYGLNEEPLDKQRALNFAVAACCLKHTISGDYNLVTKPEIEKLLSGDFSGKVSR
ncbi:sugar kinase [Flavobacterium sp. F-380]|uniref:Sugar kinase n=1 Tax=Flavobacterium kayseriense TaxID=2764714 RepID=A0ABR7J5E3_9FLAO|nr:sugar kinase [Flavobacterium kayseriense]MBC5840638.1 sugar kinase [Flavobacterium kayseriense]MBC5846692.1 sugar kinase [Flavobacterium kayseriense]